MWIKRLRELIQERLLYLHPAFNNTINKTAPKIFATNMASRFDLFIPGLSISGREWCITSTPVTYSPNWWRLLLTLDIISHTKHSQSNFSVLILVLGLIIITACGLVGKKFFKSKSRWWLLNIQFYIPFSMFISIPDHWCMIGRLDSVTYLTISHERWSFLIRSAQIMRHWLKPIVLMWMNFCWYLNALFLFKQGHGWYNVNWRHYIWTVVVMSERWIDVVRHAVCRHNRQQQ